MFKTSRSSGLMAEEACRETETRLECLHDGERAANPVQRGVLRSSSGADGLLCTVGAGVASTTLKIGDNIFCKLPYTVGQSQDLSSCMRDWEHIQMESLLWARRPEGVKYHTIHSGPPKIYWCPPIRIHTTLAMLHYINYE
jgi:hypothetical protein